jgi:hypothetical protein
MMHPLLTSNNVRLIGFTVKTGAGHKHNLALEIGSTIVSFLTICTLSRYPAEDTLHTCVTDLIEKAKPAFRQLIADNQTELGDLEGSKQTEDEQDTPYRSKKKKKKN